MLSRAADAKLLARGYDRAGGDSHPIPGNIMQDGFSIPSLGDPESLCLAAEMTRIAKAMAACEEVDRFAATGWLPDRFFDQLDAFHVLYDSYIRHNIGASRLRIQCQAGCARCCRQAVHGVYSFEIISLYRQLRTRPDYPGIHDAFLRQANEFQALVAEAGAGSVAAGDVLPRALRAYAAKGYGCPLLKGSQCGVYEHRPVSCRMYHSLTDPVLCVTPLGHTFNLEPPVEVAEILAGLSDRLAFPYSEFLAQGLVVFAARRQFRPWGPG